MHIFRYFARAQKEKSVKFYKKIAFRRDFSPLNDNIESLKILKTTGTYSGLTWKLSGVNNMTYLTISGTTTASIAQWAFFNIGITHAGHITMLVSGTPENTFQFNANGDIKFTRAISSGTTINAVFIISTDIALADVYAFDEKQESSGISIAAGATGTQNITITKSGYTPIMATLISPWNEGLALGGITITDANTAACMLVNTKSSAITARPRIKVMYVKS